MINKSNTSSEIHVIKNDNGWGVFKGNSTRALRVFSDKKNAISFSRKYVKDGFNIFIHNDLGDVVEVMSAEGRNAFSYWVKNIDTKNDKNKSVDNSINQDKLPYGTSRSKGWLIDAIAAESKLSKADSKKALDAFVSATTTALKKGDRVALVGFGSFSVAKRAARKGKNPQTGKEIKIAGKKVVKFKAGDLLQKVK